MPTLLQRGLCPTQGRRSDPRIPLGVAALCVCFGEIQTYKILQFILGCVISGFRRKVDKNCAFWTITQLTVVIPYRRFGTTYRSQLQPKGCPETSVRNYHYSLRNSPKEHGSYFGIFRTAVFWSAEGSILRDPGLISLIILLGPDYRFWDGGGSGYLRQWLYCSWLD